MNKGKRISSKDVAREAGVSQATVSYVLNNVEGIRIKPETREAVLHAAKKLNYHPDLIARSMRLKKSMSIGIVSDKNISSFVFMNVLEGIKDALVSRNYTMTLCLNKSLDIENAEHVKYYSSNRIDGIIFAYANMPQEHINFLTENNIPFVVIHTNVKNEVPHLVKTDMSEAIIQAVAYMCEKYGPRIGYIGTSAGNISSPRYQGYLNALSRCSIDFDERLVARLDGPEELSDDLMDDYLSKLGERPSAIVCDRSILAFNLIKYCTRRGIRIPQDMAIVAIGTSNFSDYSNPALSAIEAPLYDMGSTGCGMLFDILNEKSGEDVVVLHWKFIIRDSA